VPRRGVGREGRQRGIADQEDIEVFGKVLVAGGGFAEAHVGGVAGQQDVPDAVLDEELFERCVALGVIDHHVVGMHVDIRGDRDRQLPEPVVVVSRPGIKTGESLEVIDHRFVA